MSRCAITCLLLMLSKSVGDLRPNTMFGAVIKGMSDSLTSKILHCCGMRDSSTFVHVCERYLYSNIYACSVMPQRLELRVVHLCALQLLVHFTLCDTAAQRSMWTAGLGAGQRRLLPLLLGRLSGEGVRGGRGRHRAPRRLTSGRRCGRLLQPVWRGARHHWRAPLQALSRVLAARAASSIMVHAADWPHLGACYYMHVIELGAGGLQPTAALASASRPYPH